MRMRLPLLALILFPVGVAAAQAPRVSPAGDPSVRDDTIYALAVRDSAAHQEDGFIYLLDDGIVAMEADGRSTTTYRQVIQIFTREAAENWGEMSLGYAPERQRLTLNWVRVLDLDGRVLSDRPVHEQESRAPVSDAAPVYTDRVVRRVSVGAIAPGTILDYSYTTETIRPLVPAEYQASWRVTTGRPVRRSRYVVDLPASVTPIIRETNWRGARPVEVGGGRRTWTWAAAEVPRLEPEPFAARPNSIEVFVDVALPRTWEDVGRWYAQLARGRYVLTPALEAQLSRVVAGAPSLGDSLRAAHRWVAQDFRYVSLSLGLGGYQPRSPGEVLEARQGDCKDKATLFVALARRLGVRAWPVLLSLNATADSTLPGVSQFDHMIAAVEWPGHTPFLYLDLTADLTPFGELPMSEQGGFALVVRDDGTSLAVLLPEQPPSANRSEIRVAGTLSADGEFSGRFERTGTGSRQYPLRQLFAETLSDTDRGRFSRSLAGDLFSGAVGDSLQAFDGRDLSAPARLTLAVRGGRAVNRTGGLDILRLPLDNFGATQLGDELAAHGPRRFPIDAAEVVGPTEFHGEFVVRLPPGWRARLPDNVEARSAFGAYRATYSQSGDTLRVTRFLVGSRGTHPPQQVHELVDWLRAVARDDVEYVVLERGR